MSLPYLDGFIAATRSEVDPLAVARPAGDDVVGTGIGRENARTVTGIVDDVDLASLGWAIIKSDRTPIIGPARCSRFPGQKRELGGVGAITIHCPDFIITRLIGLKNDPLSICGKVRNSDAARRGKKKLG